MGIRSTTLDVTDEPTPLVALTDTDGNPTYRDILVRNTGSATVYVGGDDVDTDNGYPLEPTEGLGFNRVDAGSLPYAIVTTGTETLVVLELGV